MDITEIVAIIKKSISGIQMELYGALPHHNCFLYLWNTGGIQEEFVKILWPRITSFESVKAYCKHNIHHPC